MPDTIPTSAAATFFARVTRGLREHEARVRDEVDRTGVPYRFSYCLREVSYLTRLSVRLLRRLIRAGEIAAIKVNGWWMIGRGEFLKLLPPSLGCRENHW